MSPLKIYNVYCDESCHLEHDREPIMAIGSIWCSKEQVQNISAQIRALKKKFNANGELKWNKVSLSRIDFYLSLVEYFFHNENLNFRCLVVDDKSKLNHAYFNTGSHDSYYYKMYFYMLRNILSRDNQYEIYIDIKDTRGQRKVEKLKEVLCNSLRDFEGNAIINAQQIRSHESELLQLADFIIGAVGYENRNKTENAAKSAVVEKIKELAHHNLKQSNPPWEKKFNIFIISPQNTQ